MKLIIGISGGIGSGKSTVSALFEECGAEIIDADAIAHKALNEISIKNLLKSRFGDGILLQSGEVNRKSLAKIIFKDAKAREYLEQLIHPKVRKEIKKQIKISVSDIIVLDVPLIDNSPLLGSCTHKIFVKVPDEIRFQRVQSRGWSKEEWQQREAAQMPVEEKEKNADWVIDNTLEVSKVKENINSWILQELKPLKGSYE